MKKDVGPDETVVTVTVGKELRIGMNGVGFAGAKSTGSRSVDYGPPHPPTKPTTQVLDRGEEMEMPMDMQMEMEVVALGEVVERIKTRRRRMAREVVVAMEPSRLMALRQDRLHQQRHLR